jgi:predicted TPR repeat methyltransferase
LALGLYEQAVWDASKAVALDANWAKGHYRLGCAHLAMCNWHEAALALQRGLELGPGDSEMVGILKALHTSQQRLCFVLLC